MKQCYRRALSVGTLLGLLSLILNTNAAGHAKRHTLTGVTTTDGRAGTCYSFYPDPVTGTGRPYMPLAFQAGSRWDRFDFSWPALEPQPGQWQFGPHDAVVDDLHSVGTTNIVGILLWTPDWTTTTGAGGRSSLESSERPPGWYAPVRQANSLWERATTSGGASSPPQGLYEEWDDWTEADGDPVNTWGRFVHTCVSRYGDQVEYWEIWNEPEWTYFWTGTSTDYARLLKVGYEATKAACSHCKVLFGGLHYWANPDYYKWVLNTLRNDPDAPASNYFFDVMSVHLYSRSSTAYDVVNAIRSGMTERVSDHPIWLTETGVPVWNDETVDPVPWKYDYAATQNEAAAYVIQSYANAWAAGIERYFFFRTHDADMTEYFGLVRNDRSARPAYAAFQVAASYLISPTAITREPESDDVQQVTLWGTPRGKVGVLWNYAPDPRSISYEHTLTSATLVDQRGITQTIYTSGSDFEITLPGATANLVSNQTEYFIGGAPYLVVEEDTDPPAPASLNPLPDTTYSSTIHISWSATDELAGIWGYDVQVRAGYSAGWVDWLDRSETEDRQTAQFTTGQPDAVYCFRARAWDRAGNVGPWSDGENCTRLEPDRDVHLTVGPVFGDTNGNGTWDTDNGEQALTDVMFHLLDASGNDVMPPTVGQVWDTATTLRAGDYALLVEPDGWPSQPTGWLPRRMPLVVVPGGETMVIQHCPLGLLAHRSTVYLPVAR